MPRNQSSFFVLTCPAPRFSCTIKFEVSLTCFIATLCLGERGTIIGITWLSFYFLLLKSWTSITPFADSDISISCCQKTKPTNTILLSHTKYAGKLQLDDHTNHISVSICFRIKTHGDFNKVLSHLYSQARKADILKGLWYFQHVKRILSFEQFYPSPKTTVCQYFFQPGRWFCEQCCGTELLAGWFVQKFILILICQTYLLKRNVQEITWHYFQTFILDTFCERGGVEVDASVEYWCKHSPPTPPTPLALCVRVCNQKLSSSKHQYQSHCHAKTHPELES